MTAILLRGHELYVRTGDREAVLQEVRTAVGSGGDVLQVPGNPYCVVLWAGEDYRPPEELLEDLSRNLGVDALWLAWQKQVDAFAFQRWVKGSAVRRLAYGVCEKERTWELVDGSPEPWEGEALFPPIRLQRQLRVQRLFPDAGAPCEAELRRIWQEHLLSADSEHPRLVAIDAAHVVARYYCLPGWTL